MNAVFAVTALSSADDGLANEGDSVGGNSVNGVSDVENVIGGAGNDTLDARTITGNDLALQGNAGNDKLRGGTGRDDLCGGPGSDILYWSLSTVVDPARTPTGPRATSCRARAAWAAAQ